MKQLIRSVFQKFGYDVTKYNPNTAFNIFQSDFTKSEREIITAARPFTMTTEERIIALIRAVEYVSLNKIDGAIVECGVWRGGSAMSVALQLNKLNDTQRELFLYDTFEGMSEPTDIDVEYNGRSASEQLASATEKTGIWCYASLEDVTKNIYSTGYPREKVRFIKGKVEETIPHILPSRIALLRLDTDWYESTLHELQHLFPLLDPKGVLIIDDYGHWQGCKKAVDEYFSKYPGQYYFNRVDYACRLVMKVSADHKK